MHSGVCDRARTTGARHVKRQGSPARISHVHPSPAVTVRHTLNAAHANFIIRRDPKCVGDTFRATGNCLSRKFPRPPRGECGPETPAPYLTAVAIILGINAISGAHSTCTNSSRCSWIDPVSATTLLQRTGESLDLKLWKLSRKIFFRENRRSARRWQNVTRIFLRGRLSLDCVRSVPDKKFFFLPSTWQFVARTSQSICI